MTNDQEKALKRVFIAYEGYIVMGCEGNPWMYARSVIEAIPQLAKVFPAISLENDKLGIFKGIYFKKKEKK